MARVKFGKFESVSGLWDDDKVADVLLDGEVVGEITATRADVGGAATVIRTTGYTVSLFDMADDMDFEVQLDPKYRRGWHPAEDARTTLARAKAWVREQLEG